MSLEEFREFETKYSVAAEILEPFKRIVEEFDGLVSFKYVQGHDTCYTNNKGELMRFRQADLNSEDFSQVSWKRKRNKTNNIDRTEINWRVDGTEFAEIQAGAEFLGWKFDFSLWKMCHIYEFEDANIVFYTVRFDNGDSGHFIEIEVNEEKCVDTGYSWDVIYKYEAKLAPLNVNKNTRLRQSLAELARKRKQ